MPLLADSAERIAKRAAEEAVDRVKANRKALGNRPPWTRRLSVGERLDLWLGYQMSGDWSPFLTMLEANGVPPGQPVLKAFIDFAAWGATLLARDAIAPPEPIEELPRGFVA